MDAGTIFVFCLGLIGGIALTIGAALVYDAGLPEEPPASAERKQRQERDARLQVIVEEIRSRGHDGVEALLSNVERIAKVSAATTTIMHVAALQAVNVRVFDYPLSSETLYWMAVAYQSRQAHCMHPHWKDADRFEVGLQCGHSRVLTKAEVNKAIPEWPGGVFCVECASERQARPRLTATGSLRMQLQREGWSGKQLMCILAAARSEFVFEGLSVDALGE